MTLNSMRTMLAEGKHNPKVEDLMLNYQKFDKKKKMKGKRYNYFDENKDALYLDEKRT